MRIVIRSVLGFILLASPIALANGAETQAKAEGQSLPGKRPPARDSFVSVNVAAAHMVDTDLDAGGDFGFSHLYLGLNTLKYRQGQFSTGFSARFDTEDYRFGEGSIFGEGWDTVSRLQLSLPTTYEINRDWFIMAIPSLEFAAEGDLFDGDAMNYGFIGSVSKVFGRERVIGIGAGVFTGIGDTSGFGYIAVRWRFNEKWLIANPFRPGPTGPAGIELVYQGIPGFDVGIGSAYRSYTFRLDDEGLAPGGIGEFESAPIWLRVSAVPSDNLFIDLYLGAVTFAEVDAKDDNENKIASDEFDAGLLVGLNISARF